jgi:hypothetical protein
MTAAVGLGGNGIVFILSGVAFKLDADSFFDTIK